MRTLLYLGRVGALAILLVLAGCHTVEKPASPPPTSQFPNWPVGLNDFRFRWSAESGIDLLAGPAVPLRAYLESHRIGDFTKNPQAVYPGFDQAVAKGPLNSDFAATVDYQLAYIRPFTDPNYGFGPFTTFRGNEYLHILEMTPIENGYRAYVCDGLYKVFRAAQLGVQGKYVSIGSEGKPSPAGDRGGIQVWRVELTDKSTRATSLSEQRGPNPAPLGNVFGSWFITGASPTGYWGSHPNPDTRPQNDAAYKHRREQCSALMPDNAEQRAKFYTGEHGDLPSLEPGEPGWPGNPV
ncbi:hypothetical protein [Mycobacteroides abscessus]|uniref:hypothetical protein n=1 Tax=Mycobacteroides abscessus TaxID=36809 RepID=UPI0009272FC6|nr:hypothetical protein [Mycobacteroides abscessus]SIN21445.1 membrane protein [Mycobacteroides abscessus subsp. abscessus]